MEEKQAACVFGREAGSLGLPMSMDESGTERFTAEHQFQIVG